MATEFPLSVAYMWDVLETLPEAEKVTGGHIGAQFLPDKDFGSPRIIWEEVQSFYPMAGFYAMTDLAAPMHGLPWKSYQVDLIHSAARWILRPEEVMFFRLPGQPSVKSMYYGEGPAANDYRSRDAAKVAEKTKQMNGAMDNLNEYMRIKALLNQFKWPPDDEDGNQLSAADMPVYWGAQNLNFDDLFAFTAADGTTGAFEQDATSLVGVDGEAATQKAWNTADSNIITDMAIIENLFAETLYINGTDLTMIMSRRIASYQARNTNILNWLLGTNRDRLFVTIPDVKQAIQTAWEWKIQFYDSKWQYVKESEILDEDPTVHSVRFMDLGDVLILPSAEKKAMGYLGHCPAPVNDGGSNLMNWVNGKYLWRKFDDMPPWTRQMGIGQFAFPLARNLKYRFLLHAHS